VNFPPDTTDAFAGAASTLATVRDLLRFAVSRFSEAGLHFGHGTANAYDEAAYLILHTLHLPLDRLEPFLDARLLQGEVHAVLAILSRRVQERVPAAYLTHEAWLADHRFYVDERTIVPRSHIAELIGERFDAWLPDEDGVKRALDLCTGSGCLAILLAEALPEAKVDGADISAEALEVARRNVDDYALAERIELIRSDLFAGLGKRKYDLIVSNPPYVTAGSMERLPDEYRREPQLALAGGDDGLDIVRRIVAQARAHLTARGILVVEAGDARERVEAAFPKLELTWLETSAGDGLVFVLERDQLPA
jgi:ribosomal protein L3 glutamine methyltransferase